MDRMACVNLPELPLQMLLREHPDWHRRPAAVVDRDKPNGTILWANELARHCRILPGMRYAAGLSLSRELCAGVVPADAITREVAQLTRLLAEHSPRIEPATDEPGIFWLAATGLDRVFGSFEAWAARLGHALDQAGFRAHVAVGFTRFGCYAAAKAGKGRALPVNRKGDIPVAQSRIAADRSCNLFRDPAEEQAHLRAIPLERLGLDARLRDTLGKLGLTVAGDFLDLPEAALHRRFGPAVARLHRLARDQEWLPLNDPPVHEPVQSSRVLDYPEANFDRLQIILQPMVSAILSRFHERREALAGLNVSLGLDDRSRRHEQLTPAEPTLNERQLLTLLRLRLEALPFSAGVVELTLQGDGVPATPRQLELFQQPTGRDPAAAAEALARIRAELGNDAVVSARLVDAHLPEARYEWRLFEEFATPQPVNHRTRPLIRRLHTPPLALAARPAHEPDGWLVLGPSDGPVEEIIGPHRIEGGWWRREVARAYHYVRTRSGRWLWIYHDQRRQRWFLHGEVE